MDINIIFRRNMIQYFQSLQFMQTNKAEKYIRNKKKINMQHIYCDEQNYNEDIYIHIVNSNVEVAVHHQKSHLNKLVYTQQDHYVYLTRHKQ